jgi:hypothetical protein
MIDLVVDESFKALRNIRSAEKNMKDQGYACGMLISASHHLNTLLHVDSYMYELLRKEYDRVSDEYLECYGLNPLKYEKV